MKCRLCGTTIVNGECPFCGIKVKDTAADPLCNEQTHFHEDSSKSDDSWMFGPDIPIGEYEDKPVRGLLAKLSQKNGQKERSKETLVFNTKSGKTIFPVKPLSKNPTPEELEQRKAEIRARLEARKSGEVPKDIVDIHTSEPPINDEEADELDTLLGILDGATEGSDIGSSDEFNPLRPEYNTPDGTKTPFILKMILKDAAKTRVLLLIQFIVMSIWTHMIMFPFSIFGILVTISATQPIDVGSTKRLKKLNNECLILRNILAVEYAVSALVLILKVLFEVLA